MVHLRRGQVFRIANDGRRDEGVGVHQAGADVGRGIQVEYGPAGGIDIGGREAARGPPFSAFEKAPWIPAWPPAATADPRDARKVFIHFGAIMQTASVYVNGTLVGTHGNSGYTGFFFDISNNVVKGDTTCVAIRCYVTPDANIPPATCDGGASSPDFELWSGMYRDVTLLFKNFIYVPLWGQRITTQGTTSVHAVTNVRNDYTSSQSVTVALTLRNAGGASVATASSNQTVAAGGASSYDMTMPVTAPSLWSPTSPYLYSLQTLVSVGGVVVDSVVEPSVGFRTFSWNGTSFSLTAPVPS